MTKQISEIKGKILALQSEKPLASIVISAYNEEKYLLDTIESLSHLKTDYPLEIILVDNGSTDNTKTLGESYGLKVIEEKRKGISYARQAGLVAAKGKYIFITDADTIVPYTWIDASLKYFFKNPHLGLLAGSIRYRGASLLFYIAQFILQIYNRILGIKKIERVYGANIIYKKDAAQKVGGYTPGIHLGEDVEITKKIQREYNILITDDKQITVTTSGRRFKTISKVVQYIITQWGKEKNTYQQEVIMRENFIDIR